MGCRLRNFKIISNVNIIITNWHVKFVTFAVQEMVEFCQRSSKNFPNIHHFNEQNTNVYFFPRNAKFQIQVLLGWTDQWWDCLVQEECCRLENIAFSMFFAEFWHRQPEMRKKQIEYYQPVATSEFWIDSDRFMNHII